MFGKKKTLQRDEEAARSLRESQVHHVERKIPELVAEVFVAQGNRKYQQDNAWISAKNKKLASNKYTRLMAAVCDGMGGMADGGRASETAIKMLSTGFSKIEKMPEVNIPGFFKEAIVTIDKKISQFPKENGRGSGTTMVAVIAENNNLYWASVGDSRIYLIHKKTGVMAPVQGPVSNDELYEMYQLTRDHNYELRLREMVQAGKMTEEEMAAKKQKEALISFLGIGNVSLMDISSQPYPMNYGDVVMLCSDGVTKTLSNREIRDIIVSDTKPIQEKAKILVEHATRTNTHSQDNTSVVVLQYIEKTF